MEVRSRTCSPETYVRVLLKSLFLSIVSLPVLSSGGFAQQAPSPQATQLFESKVRPILIEKCFPCHGEKQAQRRLRLDSQSAMMKGGDSGPVVVPGDPENSLLIKAVRHEAGLKMPLNGKLTDSEISSLIEWVKAGGAWPETKTVAAKKPFAITEESKQFWSFRPASRQAPPRIGSPFVANPIDAFVLQRLRAGGLKPNPSADRRTLIRRVSLDLIGLPPTPAEVEAFVNDKTTGAWERVIDRLLASPRYGERWGRHWLDVARYADSNGLDENKAFGNAFHYRDYVIASFNEDKPYDQFIKEQIAGDLIPAQDQATRNTCLTATGYLVLGAKVLAEQDKAKMVMDIVDEQIEVISKSIMGLTVACARCHDHKFDPISQKDYYALAGIFKSTRTMRDLGFVSNWMERPLATPEDAIRQREHEDRLKQLEAQREASIGEARIASIRAYLLKADRYLLSAAELLRNPGVVSLADAPVVPGKTRTIVEAEKFDRGNVNRDFDTYGKGIGVIHNVGLPNVAEWDVQVADEGWAQIEFRYASAESRSVTILVDGKPLAENVCGAVTGSFQPDGQRWEVVGRTRLAAGKHTIKLESRSHPIPHFDKLAIIGVDPPANNGNFKTAPQLAQERGLELGWLDRTLNILARKREPLLTALAAAALTDNQASLREVALRAVQAEPPIHSALSSLTWNSLEDLSKAVGAAINSARNPAGATPHPFSTALGLPALQALDQRLGGENGLFCAVDLGDRQYLAADKDKVKKAEEAYNNLKSSGPTLTQVMAVEESDKIGDTRVHLRGSTLNLGESTPRRFLTVLDGDRMNPIDAKRSGRLELAEWLANPKHPLTGRVAVNRVWQAFFGQGLVRTPDNFGMLGDRPSHPELLDWLANSFTDGGWSFKKLHRLILTSNTYKMSSKPNSAGEAKDPDNKLLWRMSVRRLEAEPYRDSLLFVSGKLDTTMGGTLLGTKNNDYVTNDQSGNGARYNAPRRSIYLPIIRNALFDQFLNFDFGDPTLVNAYRPSTTVAPQALFSLNSPFMLEQAKALSEEIFTGKASGNAERIQEAIYRVLSRPATDLEVKRSLEFLTQLESKLIDVSPEDRGKAAWQSYCQSLLASNEFIYRF